MLLSLYVLVMGRRMSVYIHSKNYVLFLFYGIKLSSHVLFDQKLWFLITIMFLVTLKAFQVQS